MEDVPTKNDCVNAANLTEALAKERFPESLVVRVDVEPSDELDEHALLWIRAVLNTPGGALPDTKAHARFNFELRPNLEENGVQTSGSLPPVAMALRSKFFNPERRFFIPMPDFLQVTPR